MVLEAYVMFCVTAGFFLKICFCPKNGENGAKKGFLGFIGNSSDSFFLNLSIKKVHIICCILALIPYLGEI